MPRKKKNDTGEKVYYSKKTNFNFSVITRDKDGNPQLELAKGEPIYTAFSSEPAYRRITRKFNPIPRGTALLPKNATHGLSNYVTKDPDEIEVLDALVADAQSGVVTDEMYKRELNAEAYDIQVEKEQLEDQNEALKKQLEEMQAKLDEKAGKGKKPAKKDMFSMDDIAESK